MPGSFVRSNARNLYEANRLLDARLTREQLALVPDATRHRDPPTRTAK